MSDFIFSVTRIREGVLSRILGSAFHHGPPVVEYHGRWGSLCVGRNHYNGFDPLETESEILVVIGGPQLTFCSNGFLTADDPVAGTRLIAEKMHSRQGIRWDSDLSGPFALLLVDKKQGLLKIVTDLMSFIAVYHAGTGNSFLAGTHVDALALAAGKQADRDGVSLADFVLHGYVTYPHTAYRGISQLAPASVHEWNPNGGCAPRSRHYWQPRESMPPATLEDAAADLRKALHTYVTSVTCGMEHVGVFLSGGEDSRTVLSLLPERCRRDSIVFLDSMNREGRVARKAAAIHGARFRFFERSPTRYLDVLPQCSDLVGCGAEYTHVHTWGFHETAGLAQYTAVFGGLYSDALFKGSHVPKWKGLRYLPFLPRFSEKHETQYRHLSTGILENDVFEALERRRREHMALVRTLRPRSANEWFELWPSSMNRMSPNLHGNRRLFRSYEPFISCEAVKLSARIPQEWKLNRRLIQRMAKPLLKASRFLPHADGWLPYYPWPVNMAIRAVTFPVFTAAQKTGLVRGSQGPWCDWNAVMSSEAWRKRVADAVDRASFPEEVFTLPAGKLFESDRLTRKSKINLLQTLYQLGG